MLQPIGTLGTIDNLTVGGRVFTDLTNLIQLYSENLATGGNFTFRKLSASSGYAPSGVTFLPKAFNMVNPDASSRTAAICSSDNDVGFSSASSLTNPVRPAGSASGAMFFAPTLSNKEFPLSGFVVSSGKFVSGDCGTGGQSTRHWLYGYEA